MTEIIYYFKCNFCGQIKLFDSKAPVPECDCIGGKDMEYLGAQIVDLKNVD